MRSSNVPVSPVARVNALEEPIAAVFSLAESSRFRTTNKESVLETIGVVVAYLVTDEPVAMPTPVWLSVYPEQIRLCSCEESGHRQSLCCDVIGAAGTALTVIVTLSLFFRSEPNDQEFHLLSE